ncbi:thioredoxin fold domain-containing protein [Pelomonas sp. APW6]|uniref:Thioredoxin fold domain-containing protein n=1 Tax=Roseateles subflavus TaxID=3053353 RepID=A0ABT7LNE1_9BURK|nr:thioredoxin fold domain-containing protein [Pelomonas sp. APW6]MDL5034386.1 thioredoxin fold domain-containing protein [Pelomonas sp. APW6]
MNIIKRIRDVIQRILGNRDPSDTLQVTAVGSLRVSGDKAILHLSSGMAFEASLQLDDAVSKFVVRVAHLGGGGSDMTLPVLDHRFDLSDVVKAREFYLETIQSWRQVISAAGTAKVGMRSFLWPFACGAAVVVALAFFFSPGASSNQGAAAAAASMSLADTGAALARQQAQTSAAAPGAGAKQQQAVLSDEEAKKVASAGRVLVREGKKMLVAFSDPNCPSCRDLDMQASRFDGNTGLTVIPVAYKEGSRDLAASILCSTNPGKAWADYMQAGKRPGNGPCDKGLALVDANKVLFEQIGGTATPTLVAPNGTLAAGAADTPVLVAWVAGHSR